MLAGNDLNSPSPIQNPYPLKLDRKIDTKNSIATKIPDGFSPAIEFSSVANPVRLLNRDSRYNLPILVNRIWRSQAR
jgi:hypothetical protein